MTQGDAVELAWTPQSVAEEMKSAQDACREIEPFTARLHGFDSASAYEVARLIHERRVAEGAVPVGRKIGFTNRTIWAEYGVYEPTGRFEGLELPGMSLLTT